MANNLLFIYNKESNTALLFAKAFGEWECRASIDAINDFLTRDDWASSCIGGQSNFVLLTAGQLPEDVLYFQHNAEAKQKAIEGLTLANELFKPKPHVSFKRKLEEKKHLKHRKNSI